MRAGPLRAPGSHQPHRLVPSSAGALFGVWCLRLGFGFWCLVFGVWCLMFGVWCLVFGVWVWGLEPPAPSTCCDVSRGPEYKTI